jgi:hypothetical protein
VTYYVLLFIHIESRQVDIAGSIKSSAGNSAARHLLCGRDKIARMFST